MFIYSALLPSSSSSYIYFYIMYYSSTFLLQNHHPGGRTTWPSDFFADQLVGPLGSWTSSLTSWSDCSAFTSTRRSLRRRPVGWAARCSILRQPIGRIVRRFIVSYAGGSPAKLGTPRRLDCSSLHHQLHWGSPAKLGTPRCSITLPPTSWLGCSVHVPSPTN